MTAEGRLARGKENYDSGKFLDNQETIDYVKTLEVKENKPKEAKKNAKPTK